MLLKLGRDVAPYEIYQMVHILMLLWQHARFQSLSSSKSNVCFFFEFSQTLTSVSITRQKHGEHVFYFIYINQPVYFLGNQRAYDNLRKLNFSPLFANYYLCYHKVNDRNLDWVEFTSKLNYKLRIENQVSGSLL